MPGEIDKSTVLVVDDDDTIVSLIDMVLSFEGYRCIGATNGEDAVKLIEETNPSLILLDLSMPRMDGKEFCRWLRNSPGHSEVPVIIMTAGQNAVKTCEEIGGQGCLIKPFEVADLQAVVRKWIKK